MSVNILKKKDWRDDLTMAQKSFLERSARQIDEGKVVPHSTVQAEINRILQKPYSARSSKFSH